MTLLRLIRKRSLGGFATVFPAIQRPESGGTVAKIAGIAVANPAREEAVTPAQATATAGLTVEQEAAILVWLDWIGETDAATIAEVMDECRQYPDARDFYVQRAEEDLPNAFDHCWSAAVATAIAAIPATQAARSTGSIATIATVAIANLRGGQNPSLTGCSCALALSLVSCDDCRHYRPDPVGHGGLGHCLTEAPESRRIGSLWPGSRLFCSSFEALAIERDNDKVSPCSPPQHAT